MKKKKNNIDREILKRANKIKRILDQVLLIKDLEDQVKEDFQKGKELLMQPPEMKKRKNQQIIIFKSLICYANNFTLIINFENLIVQKFSNYIISLTFVSFKKV